MLAGLQQKMKYSDRDGFCCLVAASAADPTRIVGVVEVSLQGEKVGGRPRWRFFTTTKAIVEGTLLVRGVMADGYIRGPRPTGLATIRYFAAFRK